MKCKHCGHEIERETIKIKELNIKELNIEVETNIQQKGKSFNEIKIPKGWRLLTMEEIKFLHNSKYKEDLNLVDTWEFIEQPLELNKKNDYVAGFNADSYWANFVCYWGPDDRFDSLGVRFCRDLK